MKKFGKIVSSIMLMSLPATAVEGAELQLDVTSGEIPVSGYGKLRHSRIYSDELKANLTVDIWLPASYDEDVQKRFPVVYMHDGQNLFDPALSYAGAAWEIDNALEKLIGKEIVHAPIVVGIHNRGTHRPADYIPERPVMEYIAEADREASGMWELTGSTFTGDEYMSFLVNTLKPEIDRLFRTLPDRENTSVMGSSMGGLASLYAMCEYPEVFGCAACLSTHWIGNFDYGNTVFPTAMLSYVADHLPDCSTHRLYLDRGTEDLDSSYEKWELQARELVRGKGYTEEAGNFLCYTDEGATHNEIYWAGRVERPLHFILHSTDDPYIPDVPEMQAFHVIFQDLGKNWNKVNAFVWSPGVLQLGTWPGTPMTEISYDDAKAWEITFTHKITPTNIIFNNGSSQTSDLDFKTETIYDFTGPLKEITSGVRPITGDSSEGFLFTGDSSADLRIMQKGRTLYIESPSRQTATLTTLTGHTRRLTLFPGLNIISDLPSGLHLLNQTKILIP